jgi:hypothetical protein
MISSSAATASSSLPTSPVSARISSTELVTK